MQPPSDEYAWFRQQFSESDFEQYRRERFNTQALAEIGEHEGIETDAAFIADWTRWASEREAFRAYEPNPPMFTLEQAEEMARLDERYRIALENYNDHR